MKKNSPQLSFVLFLFVAFFLQLTTINAKESTWITDYTSGCKIWNPRPQPNETISYRGECKDGKAHGSGTLIWLSDGKQNGKPSVGNFVDGVFVGDKNFKGNIIGLPNNDYFISLGTDKETGIIFWAYAINAIDRCWRWTGGGHDVYGEIPEGMSSKQFLNNEFAQSLIIKGAEMFQKNCKFGRVHVRLIPDNYKAKNKGTLYPVYVSGEIEYSDTNGKWVNYNNEVINLHKEKIASEKKKKDIESRNITSQKIFDSFVNKNDVEIWPSKEELHVNPFVYENKVVGIITTFTTMLSANQGIFDDGVITVSDIPKGIFRKEVKVVLAGRVLGKESIKIPLVGETLVPKLKFIDVYYCNDNSCSEMFYWKNN